MQNNSYTLNRDSMIVATVVVSASELYKTQAQYFPGFEDEFPEIFQGWLYQLGMDIKQPVIKQSNLRHRNRLNEVVLCDRWFGEERQDEEWINSGYASKEAKDKYSGNKILEDLYRSRQLTVDTQQALEDRDRHTVIDESSWE